MQIVNGQDLRRARRGMDLTQQQLADRLDRSRGFIIQQERTHRVDPCVALAVAALVMKQDQAA